MSIDTEQAPAAQPELLLDNLQTELDAVELYRYLAERESDEHRAGILRDMADMEARHARVMERGLNSLGISVPRHRTSFQTRVMKGMARMMGPGAIYPLLHGTEISGAGDYASQDKDTAALATEERSHARTLGELSKAGRRAESWHRNAGGGSLRAAIFGVSDGLCSNLSLVMGFAGAQADAKFLLLGGLSGLLAGAASMAAGEYVSMKAQRELLERQIDLEAAELMVTPEEEMAELALIYRAKGIPRNEAEHLARQLTTDPRVALDTLVREELGLDPGELGSPYGAAISSFLAFALGALIPVLPFFFGASAGLVALSLALSGVALFSVGALLSIFTGRSALFSGMRQLGIGAAAAAITFAVGKAIGVSTGV